ncbi:MAG: ABC transporter ATP-binding protein [Halanaerobiaceae bacterium]
MTVEINAICKSFSDVKALNNVSFKINKGEFISLLGPSGCGKTTLLRIIAGLETPDKGIIRFANKIIFSDKIGKNISVEKRGLGMVFQDFALWPHLTVFENVAFGLKAQKKTKNLNTKVMEALRRVHLVGFEERYPSELSGGQQQRVSFARAIVIEPAIILLDEPLSALDAVLRNQMRIELVSLVKDLNLTAIYVTHDQGEAMSMSDRIFVMNSGQILQKGTPETLYNKPVNSFVANFIGKVNVLNINNSKKLFRPESINYENTKYNSIQVIAIVLSSSYLGDRYEVLLDYDGEIWTSYFQKQPEIGEYIKLYIAEDELIAI